MEEQGRSQAPRVALWQRWEGRKNSHHGQPWPWGWCVLCTVGQGAQLFCRVGVIQPAIFDLWNIWLHVSDRKILGKCLVRTVQTDGSTVLLFGIAMVTGEMVLENPWTPEVSVAPGLPCVLASKADFPPQVSLQYYRTLRKSQTAKKRGLPSQPNATFGFYVEILDLDFSFGLYLGLWKYKMCRCMTSPQTLTEC